MINKYTVFLALFLPTLAWAQTESDALEAAKLGLIEKMYEKGADQFRSSIADRGYSSEEVEKILFEAIDAHASCTAQAAQAQAREQGLSEDIVLKGFGRKTHGKEESLVLLALDMEALKLKTAPCAKAFGEKIGVIVR